MAKMRSEKVLESKRNANDKYDAKTYKKITIGLRLKDDADIIEDIGRAQSDGLALREWLRGIFDKAK